MVPARGGFALRLLPYPRTCCRIPNLSAAAAAAAAARFVAQALADALDEGDVEAFTTAVADYDSLTRLDAWKTTLLVCWAW